MTTATKYKTYPKYKPSGIDWLGDIPEGWEVEYLKNLGFFTSSGIDKKIIEGEPLIRMVNYTDIYGNEAHVIDGNRELMTVSCPAWKIPESNLIKGDLVFTPSSETVEDIGLSALIFENLGNTVFSYHVIRFRFSKPFDHEFKKYWCNNNFVLQQFSSAAKGTTRQILDRNDFKNIYVVVPPIEEQKRIADFLDHETEKIDEVTVKKQKLIELLKEKRQAIISQAVTKGLDPKAKMKPSGIDWLGDIPEGWEVEYMKNLGRFDSSGIDKKIVEGEPLVRMVNYTDIYGNESRVIDSNRDLMTVSCPAWKISEANLIKGDLVFTPSSETIEDIGLSALISGNLKNTVFSYHVIRFRFSEKFDHGFKKYWCNNTFVWQQFSGFAKETTRQILDRNDFKNAQVVIPPIEEQKTIADFLDRETTKIDEVMEKIKNQIEKLQEFRQSLISNVVTGEIKIG